MEIQIDKLHNQAVDAALKKNWKEAIELNKKILDIDEENVDALLAISYAYLEENDLKKSKKYYKLSLKLDPANIIARNNLDKINILLKKGKSRDRKDNDDIELTPETFINIKGKTRVVTLMNIGQAEVIADLKIGEKIQLKSKKRRLEVRNKKNEYIGCLPDDVSKRLIFFLDAKSTYTVIIKSATKNSVDIFVREESKGKKVENYVSFPENIQDDMKTFMGKDGDGDNDDEDNSNQNDGKDDDDEAEIVDDIEKLAENNNTEKEEYLGVDTSSHDDDDLDD